MAAVTPSWCDMAMSRVALIYPLGALLVLCGLIVPSTALVEAIRTVPPNLRNQLILGGTFFKIGLVLSGLFLLGSKPLWQLQPQTDAKATTGGGTTSLVTLAMILVAALLIRLHDLGIGIWFDEIVTHVSYMHMTLGEILTTYDNQNNHLLYTWLARLSLLTFGDSVWALRLPAVLLGVGSIWAVYLFAREVGTVREGLLAAAFLAFSYHHVWFSQNARGYTGLLFWTVISSWLLLRALREAKIGLWLLFGFATAAGLWTHVTMAFVLVAQGLVYLLSVYQSTAATRRDQWLGGALGFGVAGLVTFQLYALVLPQLFNWQGPGVASWQGKVAVLPWKSPIWMIGELLNILNIGLGGGILLLSAVFIFGAGVIDFARKISPAVILFVVPILVGVSLILAVKSTLLPRLFFFAAGFAVVILVRGLMLCGNWLSHVLRVNPMRGPLVGAALCVCLVAVSGLSVARAYQPKQDYAAALDYVQDQRQPGDRILTVGLTVLPYQEYYKVDWDNVSTLKELDEVRSKGGKTWLVYTMPIVLQAAHPDIMERIEKDFVAVKEFHGTVNGGNIVVAVAKS